MPFYLRKAISAGPFRFNLSKSGVGLSVGVRGFRIGTGPRGHYVHAGRGGVYYRQSLNFAGERSKQGHEAAAPARQPAVVYGSSGVEMVEVESRDVLEMRSESFGELLDELNAKQRQQSKAALLGWGVGGTGLLALLVVGVPGLVALLLALPAWAFGRWLDSYQRATVLFYNLDSVVEQKYRQLTDAFDKLENCSGKWHVEAGGAVQDLTTWKRNAGASHIITKKPTALEYKLPGVLKSNLTPPSISVGKQTMYFFPDIALVEGGKNFGAVSYQDLKIKWEHSNFIEEGKVPTDAEVVRHTWKHPNKNGGPDRRFNNNYQIPVCCYEVAHFTSTTGVNELVEFSRTGVVEPFARALGSLPKQAVAGAAPALQDR